MNETRLSTVKETKQKKQRVLDYLKKQIKSYRCKELQRSDKNSFRCRCHMSGCHKSASKRKDAMKMENRSIRGKFF